MENSGQRIPLILLSLVFVIFGFLIILATSKGAVFPNMCIKDFKLYRAGQIVLKEKGKECLCTNGRVVCADIAEEKNGNDLQISDFRRDNLVFNYKYFSSGASSDLLSKELGTSFKSVVTDSSSIKVEVLQSQMCSDKGVPAVQIGLYNYSDSILTLLNVLNTIDTVHKFPCTVSLTYSVSKINIKSDNEFRLAYQDEEGRKVDADVCLYNGEIYNDGDNYISEDRCNICTCIGGVSKCSLERVCESKE